MPQLVTEIYLYYYQSVLHISTTSCKGQIHAFSLSMKAVGVCIKYTTAKYVIVLENQGPDKQIFVGIVTRMKVNTCLQMVTFPTKKLVQVLHCCMWIAAARYMQNTGNLLYMMIPWRMHTLFPGEKKFGQFTNSLYSSSQYYYIMVCTTLCPIMVVNYGTPSQMRPGHCWQLSLLNWLFVF